MKIHILRCIVLGLVAITMAVTVGCNKRDDSPFGTEGEAAVSLSLALDQAEHEMAIGGGTKAGMPVIDPHKDLKIHIENNNKDTLVRWDCFDDVPDVIKFKAGAYKVVAEWGAGTKIPAFETYSYRGEEKFVIKAGDQLHINLLAKLATTKISVEFDSNFGFYYQDYSVDIRTVGVDSLRFEGSEARAGFFEPGSVRLRFNLVTPTGQKLSFSPEPLTKASAAEYYKLKLKVNSDAGSSQIIIGTTDDTTNPDKTITVEIPKFFLPKDKPVFSDVIGFTSGLSKSVFEGEEAEWRVVASVPGGIASFVLRMNDPTGVLAGKLGGQTVIDLASLPSDSPTRDMLRRAGFIWSAGLNSPEDAAISATAWLDFTDVMVAQSDGSPAQYDFNIEMTDNYSQTPDAGVCVVKAEIKVPTVTFVEPVPGNMWATKGEFTVKANYDLVNGASPVLQFRRKTGTGVWNNAVEGADGDVIISALNGGAPDANGLHAALYVLRGLQPNTEYEFRTTMNGRMSAEYSLITEAIAQIPNSDFLGYSNTLQKLFGVEEQFTGWATRNAATTGQKELLHGLPADGSTCVNGTYREQAEDGAYWTCMKTSYWGRSDTRAKTWGSWGAWGTTTPKNTTAGILYLGSYSYTLESKTASAGGLKPTESTWEELTNEGIVREGIPFSVRPVSLDLNYIFLPKRDDDNRDDAWISIVVKGMVNGVETVIGTGEWRSGTTNEDEKTTKTPLSVPINYTTYRDVKATKLDVLFSSSIKINEAPACNGETRLGNIFKIRDLSLGY